MFENFNAGTLLMIVLAAIIGIYLYRLDKKEKSDPLVALYKQYSTLTADTLAATPDDELVNAVAANIMAKTNRLHPDVYSLIPVLSHGQVAVYCVWILCHELETTDMASLLRSPSVRFAESAAAGFSLIGADLCVDALLAAMESQDASALQETIADQKPLSLCAAYIRENPNEFVDL